MSIKIYYGLRAVEEDPFKVGLLVRRTLNPIFFAHLKKIEERIIELGKDADLEDRFLLPYAVPHAHTTDRTAFNVMQALKESAEGSFPHWDIGYDVELIPSATGGAPLAFVFSGNSREYIKALLDAGVFVEYGYWDNTDEPDEDEVSPQEWAERKAAWGIMLNDNDHTTESVGLSIQSPSSFQCSLHKYAPEAQEKEFSLYW